MSEFNRFGAAKFNSFFGRAVPTAKAAPFFSFLRFDMKTNSIQLVAFQFQPTAAFLALPTAPIASQLEAFVDDGLFDSADAQRDLALKSMTYGEFLAIFGAGSKADRQKMSRAFNFLLSQEPLASALHWEPPFGVRVSDPECVAKGAHRDFMAARFCQFKVDRVLGNGEIHVNAHVKNRAFFSKPLLSDVWGRFFAKHARKVWVQAIDTQLKRRCVIHAAQTVNLCDSMSSAKNALKWGESLMNRKRISPQRWDEAKKNFADSLSMSASSVISPFGPSREDVAHCGYNLNNAKRYWLSLNNLELVASTQLQGFVQDFSRHNPPAELEDAAKICAEGFALIKEGMSEKAKVHADLGQALSQWLTPLAPRPAISVSFDEIQMENSKRRDQKFFKPVAAAQAADAAWMGVKVILAYPDDGKTDLDESLKKYFIGKTAQIRRAGFDVEMMAYDLATLKADPAKVADLICQNGGDFPNVVVAWRGKTNSLLRHRPLELELLKRNAAVQHLHDGGQHANANKVGNLIQAMLEKFISGARLPAPSLEHFDLSLGLDVSRLHGLDMPSFPVSVSADGSPRVWMPANLDSVAKEKRSEDEIVAAIREAAQSLPADAPKRVLFLRDGYAQEDYDAIARRLPDVELTVVSVRKNLLNAHSPNFPEGVFSAVYADHDDARFLFGVNARLGEHASIQSLHMAEIVRDPQKLDHWAIAQELIALCRQNRTTEFNVAGLPFPIAYADRAARDTRELMQDLSLRKHVREAYAPEVDQAGDENAFIYETLRRHVTARPNGYAFAV